MKKLVVFAALAAAFLIFACDNGNVDKETNPLIGTWDNVNPPIESGYHLEGAPPSWFSHRFVFTKNEVRYYFDKSQPEPNWTLNYTYDEFEIKAYDPKHLDEPGYSITIYRLNYSDGEYLNFSPSSEGYFKKVK